MMDRSPKKFSINIYFHGFFYNVSMLCSVPLRKKIITLIFMNTLRVPDLSIYVECHPHLCNILGTLPYLKIY